MTRRELLTLLAATVGAPLAAEAQPSRPPHRLGFLGVVPPTAGADLFEDLLQALEELGYHRDRNIVVERRFARQESRLGELAAELVALKVDVIVASATQPVHAAAQATRTIPIVMSNHSDPIGSRLVMNLARPNGNITGLSILNPELTGKRVALLKEALPRIRRVAVLWNPGHQAHPSMLKETAAVAGALELQLQKFQARGQEDYNRAFSTMASERAEGLVVLGDVTFWSDRTRIAELATRHHVPTIFAQKEHVQAGGLMSYGADLRDNFRRAAVYVAKILKGAKPSDLPIEQPTKFELVINLKTAKALGLTIPQSLLLRADQVIE